MGTPLRIAARRAAGVRNRGVTTHIPERLAASCRGSIERTAWLERLPAAIEDLRDRWRLSIDPPFDHDDVSCAWVAPVAMADGARAVLKLGMPHLEGTHELDGLRFWDGDPTVHLLDADAGLNAMLLERCEPLATCLARSGSRGS